MRARISGFEPNPIDKAAMTMAAEAVNSMEPIRSVFTRLCLRFVAVEILNPRGGIEDDDALADVDLAGGT